MVVRLKAVRRKQKAAPAAVSLGCLGSLLCVQTENCTTLSETHCVFCDCLRSFVYAQNNYNLVEGLNLVGYHILQSSSVFSLMTGNTLLVQKSTIHFFLFLCVTPGSVKNLHRDRLQTWKSKDGNAAYREKAWKVHLDFAA